MTLIYNNKRMNSDSPTIIHSEFDLESKSYMSISSEQIIFNHPYIRF